MRDRLTSLISEAEGLVNNDLPTVEQIADYLIEHGVIVPPCKVGDKVYIIDVDYTTECDEPCVVEVVVLMLYIGKHGIAVDLSLPLGFRLNTMAMVGKNVFLTREDAEKALAERGGR